MTAQVNFEGRVAIVTGAGNGLGRSHALELARRGAKVVVNDLGGARDGSGASSEAAQEVVALIKEMGGEAFAHGANVANYGEVEDMVKQTMDQWGQVDILINNAGILRDKSFAKMDLADFKLVMDVHVMGSVNCTKAVWDIMREQNYGRIVMTTSSSGMYGNFGQTNYGAAKAGIAGFMRCLWLEGIKYGITVNVLAPTATSRLTTDILPEEVQENFPPEAVSPAVVWLCSDEAKEISGRQWLVAGNNVSLLSWQLTPIATRNLSEGFWEVDEIGEKILESKENWPPINPMRR